MLALLSEFSADSEQYGPKAPTKIEVSRDAPDAASVAVSCLLFQAVSDHEDDETKKAAPAPVEVKTEVSTRRVRRCARRGCIADRYSLEVAVV